MSAEVIRLTAVGWARACLEAARVAETEFEAQELLERHRRMMRKTEVARPPAGELAAAPELGQRTG